MSSLIGQDQSLQHFDRCLLKLGNGDLLIAEQPDSIHIPPENLRKIQDDSDIANRESLRHFMEKVFPDINGNFHAPEQQWIFGWQYKPKNSSVDQIIAVGSQELLPGAATFYAVLTVQVILEIPPDFPWNSSTSSLLLFSLHITSI